MISENDVASRLTRIKGAFPLNDFVYNKSYPTRATGSIFPWPRGIIVRAAAMPIMAVVSGV